MCSKGGLIIIPTQQSLPYEITILTYAIFIILTFVSIVASGILSIEFVLSGHGMECYPPYPSYIHVSDIMSS